MFSYRSLGMKFGIHTSFSTHGVMILSWGLVKCQSGAVCVCVCVQATGEQNVGFKTVIGTLFVAIKRFQHRGAGEAMLNIIHN